MHRVEEAMRCTDGLVSLESLASPLA
jgi:hypothetical protein